jgi:uncharacterized protein YndB with AHSA1/START domain
MSGSDQGHAAGGEGEIVVVRTFDAPRALVFRNWTEAAHLAVWFAAEGYRVVSAEADARAGGKWRVEFQAEGASGGYVEHGLFEVVSPPERLVFTLIQEMDGGRGATTRITVTFAAVGDRTEITFRQSGFTSSAQRDGNREGWLGCFAKLDRHLAARNLPAEVS